MDSIGRTHFKAVHIGWNLGEMENVNLAKIGRELMNSGKGKVTEKGMLFEHEGAKFINEYDGHNFPEYLYATCRIFAELKKEDRKEYMYLPTHELAINKALKKLGATNIDECSKKYISEILSRELGQWMQQKAEQDKNLDIKHTDGQKVWDKPEVMEAIDDFMLRTGKIPKQTEFKNKNGLPSYGAAGRALEMSPAEYMRERYDELGIETKQSENIEMTM